MLPVFSDTQSNNNHQTSIDHTQMLLMQQHQKLMATNQLMKNNYNHDVNSSNHNGLNAPYHSNQKQQQEYLNGISIPIKKELNQHQTNAGNVATVSNNDNGLNLLFAASKELLNNSKK